MCFVWSLSLQKSSTTQPVRSCTELTRGGAKSSAWPLTAAVILDPAPRPITLPHPGQLLKNQYVYMWRGKWAWLVTVQMTVGQ